MRTPALRASVPGAAGAAAREDFQMTWRRVEWWLIVLAGICALPCGFFGFWMAVAGVPVGGNNGSPELVAKWRHAASPSY